MRHQVNPRRRRTGARWPVVGHTARRPTPGGDTGPDAASLPSPRWVRGEARSMVAVVGLAAGRFVRNIGHSRRIPDRELDRSVEISLARGVEIRCRALSHRNDVVARLHPHSDLPSWRQALAAEPVVGGPHQASLQPGGLRINVHRDERAYTLVPHPNREIPCVCIEHGRISGTVRSSSEPSREA